MKITIGVGGRFHADHMAKALLDAGHDVRLFTTFPASRFPDLPSDRIESRLWPELVFRFASKLGQENYGDLYKMQSFGRWLAQANAKREADVFLGWSSFAKETLESTSVTRRIVVRDSAHVEFQTEVLEAEFERLGLRFPNRHLCIDRELSEYGDASHILVPSEFARDTFVARGIAKKKITVLPLGVDVERFHAPKGDLTPSGKLRVIYFGIISVQKGVHVLLEAMKSLSSKNIELELIGSVAPEMRPILRRHPRVLWHNALPQAELALRLRESHVFVFPTLHDGYGQVLPQAMASGLVPIVTTRAGSASLVKNGVNGFVVEPGEPAAIAEKLALLAGSAARTGKLRKEASRLAGLPTWDAYRRGLLALIEEKKREAKRA